MLLEVVLYIFSFYRSPLKGLEVADLCQLRSPGIVTGGTRAAARK